MSILKGILHHWNKTTKSYDTIHPETESAQITDWHQGIVNTLTSDSLLAKMIQKVFSAAGLKYNIEQNGYICFGKNFGGLILQWGKFLPANDGWTSGQVNFPITFGSACLAVNVSVVTGDDKTDLESAVYHSPGLTSFSAYYSARRTRPIFWIAIGY